MMKRLDASDRERIERVIASHLDELTPVRGFLAAQPGFAIAGGKLVREPSIVVYVRQKRTPHTLAAREMVPREIEGIRVDVATAGPRTEIELLEVTSGDGLGPASEAREEREAGNAGVASHAGEADRLGEAGEADGRGRSTDAALAGVRYEGIPGDPIDKSFTIEKPMLCHAGPDAGWIVLRDFIATSRRGLTAAMYDFNADYIERALVEVAETHGFGITLTLDNGLLDDERAIHERLRERLAASYDAEIVFCSKNRRFPTAYHQKVVVRDEESLWLSSGNWSRRSQPDIDPIGDPSSASSMFSKGNREWHIVVDDEPLAKMFARYIKHDLTKAREDAALGVEAIVHPDVFVRLDDLVTEVERAAIAAPVPVAPMRLPSTPRHVKVRPLLSPDNYAKRIDKLIRSAEQRLYLQFSYITWNDLPGDQPFRDVLLHLGELSWRTDFDLRVIMDSRDAKEKTRILAQNGWNEAVVRGQGRVHNKGIVVDGKSVLVSSQNWSGDGFLRNRDAGLIVEDEEIAGYYEAIFLDDWNKRARPPLVDGPLATVVRDGERTPAGMVRMSWRDFYGD
jgi:hypothetical protein